MRKLLTLALVIATSSTFAATQYNLDTAHGSVGFSVTHLMIAKVSGRFDKYEGQFLFDDKTGKIENLTAKIDLDTVNTNENKRDDHLRNADFFGVRNDKKELVEAKRWMTFKSTKSETKNNKPTTITGDLTLNGITKPVTLTVDYRGSMKDPWGNQKIGFEAKGKISRKDFGLTWNKLLEAGNGVVVGDEVSILIDGEATAAQSTKK